MKKSSTHALPEMLQVYSLYLPLILIDVANGSNSLAYSLNSITYYLNTTVKVSDASYRSRTFRQPKSVHDSERNYARRLVFETVLINSFE